MKKLLFYCQSSLGIGHTIRSLRIAEGLARHFEVHFLNGGELIPELPVPAGVQIIDLPPIKTDSEFTTLQVAAGDLTLEDTLKRRCEIMLEVYRRVRPEIVLVELYPFGRRKFSAELKPLLKLAKDAGSRVVCSLRDILVARQDQEAWEQKVVEAMNRFFDALLVHSDPAFQSLSATFSRLEDIRAPVLYTGYVVPPLSTRRPAPRSKTIIASIGGGRFGHELAEAVVGSAALLRQSIPHRIFLYTGPFCPEAVVSRLRELGRSQPNLEIERFTPDLHDKLQRADLSISMGGYNTTMNVLATGVRAMMMGCTNNGGMDQVERVEKLGRLGVVDVIRPHELEPARFAAKILRCLEREPARAAINLNGVTTTAEALKRLVTSSPTNSAKRVAVDA